jgi:predicted  nucleic acid-binding Zn-ribbon protein
MQYLTPQEQERLAYAEGYTETAGVLARLDDAQRALGEDAAMQYEVDDANDERDRMRWKAEDLENRLDDVMAEREQARDQVKTLRSALMAIEAEVPAHVRQFIREVLE